MLRYSVAYYPEHWDETQWETDARLMQQAGVTSARIGEFAWCRMEPEEGRYEFDWLDRIIAILARHGVSVMLCTPTATPPAWLCAKHPEIYLVDEHGGTHGFGTRHQACPNHPTYRDYCAKIVSALAEHFAGNDTVYAWQLDNEYGEGNTAYCYCDTCVAGFRDHVRNKYGSLDALNRAWGTVFWSQEYTDWSQIPPPVPAGFTGFSAQHVNPSLRQDYLRFMSESWVAYQKRQIDILKAANPHWLITHNVMPFDSFHMLEYYALSEDLDVVGWDNYPRPDDDPLKTGMRHEVCRGLKRRSFWTLEGPPTIPSNYFTTYAPRPGYLRYIAYQSFAHGADMVSSFRWHAPRFGCEQLYTGLLPHSGEPGRLYGELKNLGAELAGLDIGEVRDSLADVAILIDYDSQWGLDFQDGGSSTRYWEEVFRFYRAFASHGIPVHTLCAKATDAFSEYKVLVAPMLFLADREVGDALASFVARGGVAIVTNRSGVLNERHVADDAGAPGALAKVAGVRVLEIDGACPEGENRVSVEAWDRSVKAGGFSEVLALVDAQPFATYRKHYYAGTPAVTLRQDGDGKCLYVATTLEDAFYEKLAKELSKERALTRVPWKPKRAEIAMARDHSGEIVFLLNGTDRKCECTVPKGYTPVLGRLDKKRKLTLAPLDVVILRKK